MRSRDTDDTLIKTAARLGSPSVYRLAKALDRPYRRVLPRVKTLAEAGRLQLVPAVKGGRTVIQVRLPKRNRAALPAPFPVTWSRPDGNVPVETELAAVLMRPSFAGLLDASRRFGLARVEQAARELAAEGDWNPGARADAGQLLHNLRIGHDRAARQN
ncbi:MAG TPA: hypothetical protein VFK12_08945 [Gammaproteobacteria bacterium]|nr:hypothetical protein [Gammaproteobacteria bacterium]